MRLPSLSEIATSRDNVAEFKGYNHNLRIGDGEFYDMKNLTSTYYPVLSPRGKRGTYVEASSPQGMIAKDALCYVDNGKLYINEYPIDDIKMTLGVDCETCPNKGTCSKYDADKYRTTSCEKQLVSMGAYVIIMPDKKYINTLDYSDMGNIEAEFEVTKANYEMCKADGNTYTADIENGTIPKSSTAPAEPENMQLWIDTSTTPHALKQYSKSSSVWTQVATTYIKISAPNIAKNFKQYDGVKMSGLPNRTDFKDLEGKVNILYGAYHDEGDDEIGRAEGTDDYIMVVGFLDEADTYESNLHLERRMPVLDFVIESNNRLWGCRYGTSANGEVVNEIYACKLGDFKNWNCFMQISTDSFVASCGTDGQFTGAVTHLGYPIFFKENYMHKVYGNYPANYQIQTTACRGVQKGCSESLAIVNEVLYYKSRNAVCAYDGSLPVEMSSVLGETAYSDAVACSHGNKYYISMKDTSGEYNLFVYDTSKGLWHKEDNLAVKNFCSCQNELYYIPQDSTAIKTMFGSGAVDDEPIKWLAESGVLGMYTPDRKYISRLNLRMSLDIGTKLRIYMQYDSCGEWELISSMISTNIRSFSIPLRPRRCDHFRIKIEGEGNGKIYSMSKTLEQGSDK